MKTYTRQELDRALPPINSLLSKCQKAQEKLTPGTSQWSLLANRIHALQVAAELITQERNKLQNGE